MVQTFAGSINHESWWQGFATGIQRSPVVDDPSTIRDLITGKTRASVSVARAPRARVSGQVDLSVSADSIMW